MKTLFAYMAGCIDSDGYITVTKRSPSGGRTNPSYYPRVGINQTDPIVPELFRATFGGHIHRHVPKNPGHKPWFIWQAEGPKAAVALRKLKPFLRLKQVQAEHAINLAKRITRKAGNQPHGPNEIEERERIWRAVVGLNQPRNRRVHLTPP